MVYPQDRWVSQAQGTRTRNIVQSSDESALRALFVDKDIVVLYSIRGPGAGDEETPAQEVSWEMTLYKVMGMICALGICAFEDIRSLKEGSALGRVSFSRSISFVWTCFGLGRPPKSFLSCPSSLFYTSQGPLLSSLHIFLLPFLLFSFLGKFYQNHLKHCQADLHDPRPAHSNHSWSKKSPFTFFYTYNYPLGSRLDHTIFGNS